MDTKLEGTAAIVAALLVIFSAMWDPRDSAMIALLALAGFGLYRLLRTRKDDPDRKNEHRP